MGNKTNNKTKLESSRFQIENQDAPHNLTGGAEVILI